MITALIQQKYHDSKEKTISKTCEMIKEAAKNGAVLITLQELHQTYYFCQNESVDAFDLANTWEDDILFWGNIAKENNVGEILKQLDRARYADRKNNYQPRVKAQTDSQLVTQKLSLNNSNIARLF